MNRRFQKRNETDAAMIRKIATMEPKTAADALIRVPILQTFPSDSFTRGIDSADLKIAALPKSLYGLSYWNRRRSCGAANHPSILLSRRKPPAPSEKRPRPLKTLPVASAEQKTSSSAHQIQGPHHPAYTSDAHFGSASEAFHGTLVILKLRMAQVHLLTAGKTFYDH